MTRRLASALLAGLAAAAVATSAGAWGASGHRWIGQAAMATLPADLPAFLRTSAVRDEVGELSREPDRSKGAGQPHDADRDPGHFVDIDDTGHIFNAQGPLLAELPRNHAEYDLALGRAGIDPQHAGYLPYNIEDGYEQLVKDFTYWRIEDALLKRSGLPVEQRRYIAADLAERQQLVIRDLGVWSHYVGDGSQPMHASIHYNGWGDYPNPHGYTQDHVHAVFEGPYVHENLSEAAVQRAMGPVAPCAGAIQACTAAYLQATADTVGLFYELWGAKGFTPHDPQDVAFTLARVAAGASELRDLVVKAWNASAQGSLGRPPQSVSVRDALSGRPVPFELLYGDD